MANLSAILKKLETADSQTIDLYNQWLGIMKGGSMIGISKLTDGIMGMPSSMIGSGMYARKSAKQMISTAEMFSKMKFDYPRPY
jgi:hypothetical protein